VDDDSTVSWWWVCCLGVRYNPPYCKTKFRTKEEEAKILRTCLFVARALILIPHARCPGAQEDVGQQRAETGGERWCGNSFDGYTGYQIAMLFNLIRFMNCRITGN
jgi:hypothetical protein